MRVLIGLLLGLLGSLLVTACGGVDARTNRVPVDSLPLAAVARAVRHGTHGSIHRIVDVSRAYPDPSGDVRGAVVLVGSHVHDTVPAGDFRRRPVIVRYTSIETAERAVDGLPTGRFARVHATVLLLPAGFPPQAARSYRSVFLQEAFPTQIPH